MSASQRIQELIDRTAGPKVKATVTVDQVYAEIQHEALEFRHPRGGQAKYLEEPMFSHYGGWMQDFANGLLREGSRADEGWADVGRNLKDVVRTHAPVEFGDLRESAALRVQAGGATIVNEPARQPRLTDQELDAKDYMRHMGLSYR